MIYTCSKGFTLIELLATLTIISILTLIAIPKYQDYKARSYDMQARIDLRSIAIAEEAYYFDSEHYLACTNSSCSDLPGINRLSKGVEANVELATETDFIAQTWHTRGTGKKFVWNSLEGGPQS